MRPRVPGLPSPGVLGPCTRGHPRWPQNHEISCCPGAQMLGGRPWRPALRAASSPEGSGEGPSCLPALASWHPGHGQQLSSHALWPHVLPVLCQSSLCLEGQAECLGPPRVGSTAGPASSPGLLPGLPLSLHATGLPRSGQGSPSAGPSVSCTFSWSLHSQTVSPLELP